MNEQMPKTRRAATTALAALAVLASAAAHAGEISLYEDAGFNGRQVTLRALISSINSIGFNDRTTSIVVRAGRWEVCSDDGFKGDCAIFDPGQYASLDGRFDKRISSLREVGTVADAAPAAVSSYGSVELFAQPNFAGRRARIDRDAVNFTPMGFNDRASSLIVQGGSWEMCTDADFGGTCRTFSPGRYASLGYGMTKAISSARPVRMQEAPAVMHGGGWRRGQRDDTRADAPVVLFSSDGSAGRSIAVAGDITDLSSANFNDAAQSVVIETGYWEFCPDSFYRGQCRVLGPGQYARLEPALYRSISSIRAASRDQRSEQRGDQQAERRNEQRQENDRDRGADLELFTGVNFGGNRYVLRQDLANFNDGGFNDRIGSVVVNAGQWEMCVDAGFRGRCTVFGPGRYAALGGLTNQLSSVRRID